ncbi:aminoglycoside phosphotransferase family protein [Actinomycetes bacterium KLBMP 9797]
MEPLPHGYTNDTRGDATVVVKRYQGPDAGERRAREVAMLAALRGRLPVPPLLAPVPPLLASDDGAVHTGRVPGVPGQELLAAGHAEPVLRACGTVLREVHALDVFPGEALVHGDFGPNNTLHDPQTYAVTAVVDWEWARPGPPVVDLAWCEWIIRMHHPADVPALDAFFAGYGHRPPWAQRRAAMLAQCQAMLALCERWSPDAAALWRSRTATTAAWRP